MWDAQVSKLWAIDERKGGGGYNTSSPIIQYFPRQINWMRNSRSNIITLYIHGLYRWILKFFKEAGECCYFLNCSFCELANPLYLWISGTEIVWFIGIFLCLLVRNVFAQSYVPPIYECRPAYIHVPVCAIRVDEPWCKLLEKCLKLCSMKIRSSLGSILQQEQNCLQGSGTNLEFNTWPLPK